VQPVRFWKISYEVGIAALAVTTIVLALRPSTPMAERAIGVIWGVFVVDYVVRLMLARGKWRFVRDNWLDLIAIIPVGLFRAARLFRLARALRVIRGIEVLWRASATVRGVLRTNQLGFVLLFTAGLVVAGGAIIYEVEPGIGSLQDGLWWSLVTATTVGYGDIAPKTTEGRLVAAVLMLGGIGTIGMITGSIATYFLGLHRSKNVHIQHIQRQLEHWEEMSPEERRTVIRMLEALGESPGIERASLQPMMPDEDVAAAPLRPNLAPSGGSSYPPKTH
jgi:voltage-gated potassium channel